MRLLHPVSQIVIFVATRASNGALHCCTNQNYHTMKHFILLLAAVACAVSCTSKEPFTIGKGVNISHWLSQSDARGDARRNYFTRDDVKAIADMGFDHIRIPIDEEQMFDEKLNPDAEAFGLLKNALDWCDEFGLRAVVDLHILRSHHFNADKKPLFTDPAAQEAFCECWRKISDHLKKYPDSMVAYELMNEPVADDPAQWNDVVNKCLSAVREKEPRRTVVIGSNRWQSFDMVERLEVPADDENIILSFHFYNPFMFTHYHASWTDMRDIPCEVHYPGSLISKEDYDAMSDEMKGRYGYGAGQSGYNDRATLEKQIARAADAAAKMGRRIYLGEFGTLATTAEADRVAWFEDVVSLCNERGIAYAAWDYKSRDFGVAPDGKPRQKIVEILTRK